MRIWSQKPGLTHKLFIESTTFEETEELKEFFANEPQPKTRLEPSHLRHKATAILTKET